MKKISEYLFNHFRLVFFCDPLDFQVQAEYFEDIIDNINNDQELEKIKEKYGFLLNLPDNSSFEKTVEYIQNK
jgi:hypothetical protein